MNTNVMKFVKIGVAVASAGLSIATSYLEKKDLDEKITKKVAEALAEATKNES